MCSHRPATLATLRNGDFSMTAPLWPCGELRVAEMFSPANEFSAFPLGGLGFKRQKRAASLLEGPFQPVERHKQGRI
jgi:hypothetical protein